MNAYAKMTEGQLVAEYRHAYIAHQKTAQAYADGTAVAADLRASADNLKAVRAAYRAEREANEALKH